MLIQSGLILFQGSSSQKTGRSSTPPRQLTQKQGDSYKPAKSKNPYNPKTDLFAYLREQDKRADENQASKPTEPMDNEQVLVRIIDFQRYKDGELTEEEFLERHDINMTIFQLDRSQVEDARKVKAGKMAPDDHFRRYRNAHYYATTATVANTVKAMRIEGSITEDEADLLKTMPSYKSLQQK